MSTLRTAPLTSNVSDGAQYSVLDEDGAEIAVVTGKAWAKKFSCADELLEAAIEDAKACANCGGTGLVSRQYGGDGYGNRCAGLADADDQKCEDCEDIRELIGRAGGVV